MDVDKRLEMSLEDVIKAQKTEDSRSGVRLASCRISSVMLSAVAPLRACCSIGPSGICRRLCTSHLVPQVLKAAEKRSHRHLPRTSASLAFKRQQGAAGTIRRAGHHKKDSAASRRSGLRALSERLLATQANCLSSADREQLSSARQ